MNFEKCTDGQRRCFLSIRTQLTRDDVFSIVCYHVLTYGALERWSRASVKKVVRQSILDAGLNSCLYWRDKVSLRDRLRIEELVRNEAPWIEQSH